VNNRLRWDLCDIRLPNSSMTYHVIVGDRNSGFIVCLRENRIGAILDSKTLEPVDREDDVYVKITDDEDDVYVKITDDGEDNMISVSFTDPLGRKWEGVSGFMMGERWEYPMWVESE